MESASCLADNVEKAHARLQAWRNRRPDSIIWTPLLQSRSWLECKGGGGAPVFIKCESDQITGSFKLRGAINAITIAVENNANEAIFVTASTGNHGLAVAHALELVKLRSTGRIYMPRTVKATKVAQLETYGRTVSIQKVQSDDCLDAELAAGRFAKCTPGTIYLSPCNNYDVIAGQGTVAVEILHTLRVISEDIEQDLFTAGTLYATVGGGGLISGIAAFMKLRAPRWRIVGCQPKNSAAMYASVKAGNVVDVATKPTLSDGSAGGLEHGMSTVSESSLAAVAAQSDTMLQHASLYYAND